MALRLTLTLPPAFGNKAVEIDNKRFSIGRTPDNDLSIEDTSLSRRHALIEDVEGQYNLSDCGSSNGTFVNNRQITTPTELADWDVLTFGAIGDILVRVENSEPLTGCPSSQSSIARDDVPDTPSSRPLELNDAGTITSLISAPVIAVAAVVLIVLISGLILLIVPVSRRPSISKKPPLNMDNRNDDSLRAGDVNASPKSTDSSSNDTSSNTSNVESTELLTIEAYASKVLSGISRDTHPVLTEKPLSEISAEVQRYNGAQSLQEQLRSMKRALPRISELAKANGIRPALAVYATLATIDRNGGHGDVVEVAATLCPSLARMRAVFGDELANDSLLTVAGLEDGPSLQGKITRLAGRVNDSPSTIRSIWYLHDHQAIDERTYNFVLRFLSIGVIAQDPRKFGIAADPLLF